MTGASSRFYDLNKSTGGKSTRTIRAYCLGADDHIATDGFARDHADALIGVRFRNALSGQAVSIGVLFRVAADEPGEGNPIRFVAPDYALSLDRLAEILCDLPNDLHADLQKSDHRHIVFGCCDHIWKVLHQHRFSVDVISRVRSHVTCIVTGDVSQKGGHRKEVVGKLCI